MLFKSKISEKIKEEEIIKKIYSKDLLTRYIEFFAGLFLCAISFNIFFIKNETVYGVGGISLMLNHIFGIDRPLVILIGSIILLFFSWILLGKEKTNNSILGSLLYPIVVKLTEPLIPIMDLNGMETILMIALGAIINGFGAGLIFKAGFTTGGTDILNQIVSKYGKVSMGTAMLFTDGLIILSSGFVFGIVPMVYSFVSLYLISMITDKVIIGISQSKAFYIITEHETAVKGFFQRHLAHGVTVFDVRGGYTGNHQKMIMCILPTKEYFFAKEAIKEIDPNAFFVVTDAYEVSGGE